MVDKNKLDRLAKALDGRSKQFTAEEKQRALAAEDELQININSVEEMFDGKALKYLTQAEYNALSEEEKNNDGVVYYIIDSEDVTVTQEMINNWDGKASQDDVDNITDMLNGHSIWVGTSTELAAIEERDPNTLYFEIDDGTNDVVDVAINNNLLALTADKYQQVNMVDGVNVVFPVVDTHTEIHLYFDANEAMNVILPECRIIGGQLVIEAGKSYELIAVYNGVRWLVEVKVYEDMVNTAAGIDTLELNDEDYMELEYVIPEEIIPEEDGFEE